MQLSEIGRAVLIAREGRRLLAYADSKGVPTIGVGHTSTAGPPKVAFGMILTEDECDAIFARDILRFALPIVQHIQVPVADHQFDALVSFAFNIGVPGFLDSTVLRRLNAGDYHGASEALLMWKKPSEIIPRRTAERDQFTTPYAKTLPKARSTDTHPIKLPAGAVISVEVPIVNSHPPMQVTPSASVGSRPSLTNRLVGWLIKPWVG